MVVRRVDEQRRSRLRREPGDPGCSALFLALAVTSRLLPFAALTTLACGPRAESRPPATAPAASADLAPASPPLAPPAAPQPPPPAPPAPVAPIDPAEDPRFATAIRLDLDAIRAHPIGRRMGKAIAKLDPLRALASPTFDPLRDLDTAVWLGTSDVRSSKASQVLQTKTQGPALTLAVRRLAPLATDDQATSFFVKIGKRPANVTIASPLPTGASPAATVSLLAPDLAPFTAPLVPGSAAGELVEMRFAEPWRSFPSVPKNVSSGSFVVSGRDDGGALVTMTGTCTDEVAARVAEKIVRANVQKFNVFPLRLLTRRALDTAKVAHDGKQVTLDVSLARDQVEALARLMADEMNADLLPP